MPEGSSVFRAALRELEAIEWTEPEIISTTGMPFNRVGRSNCVFREGAKRATSQHVLAAIPYFPEIEQLGWPSRGSVAERDSLLLQASKFRATRAPGNLKEAVDSLLKLYPKSRAKLCFRRGTFLHTDLLKQQIKETAQSSQINKKASPGSPWARLGKTNQEVLSQHFDFLQERVFRRLHKLAGYDTEELMRMTPAELVREGLCDPVRLFVKQEPHTEKKLHERRFRLISSVSLPDQLIERMLFGPQNELEIASWARIPSKPGMGLSESSQAQSIWRELSYHHLSCPAAEADISGFDWSVQEWELWADLSIRVDLCMDMHDGLRKLMVARFYCFMNSVFQLSNGELFEQKLPGLMKSGSYCTSSTNSRIRCLMGHIIGSPWIIAMGDDSVEGFVENATEKYHSLGHTCKEYSLCEIDRDGDLARVNFCSHEIKLNSFHLTSWPKTLYRFLSSPVESFDELQAELHSCPAWPRIVDYLRLVGRVPDKSTEESNGSQENDHGAISPSSQEYDGVEHPPFRRSEEKTQKEASTEYHWVEPNDSSPYGFRCDLQDCQASSWWPPSQSPYRACGASVDSSTGAIYFCGGYNQLGASQLQLADPDGCSIL
ncbi:ORF2b [Physalis rugose mosaic virus]|uniref:RNA-directed RNA polymerase n=1 Tax=Physalis rugose mosaic virus TaxID=2607629 RepID=A0A5C1IRK5_9VIRU|nr:ORF2b [Physalis rugose mosaic virus]QEM20965.1 ORF2b [Physalis rugose mosaic virus]